MTTRTGSQDWSGEHSASPQDLRTDLGVRGSGAPLGFTLWLSAPIKQCGDEDLLAGWLGAEGRGTWFCMGWLWCGVVWQQWGVPKGNIPQEAFSCWGLSQGVSQEGRGSREWERERKDATKRDTRQGVRLAWPTGLVLQPQTL